MKLILIISVLILSTSQLRVNDLIFGWHKVNETGEIYDINFLPGGDQFAALSKTGEFQIRDTETGDVVKIFNNFSVATYANFEFTPDSNKVIIANTGNGSIAMYNLEDLSLINSASIHYDELPTWVTNMAVDPVKPYVYITVFGMEVPNVNHIRKGQVSVYNYETMELVQHLTEFTESYYPCIAVSSDGKYLAAMNYGATYLHVWDLDNFELIRKFKLFEDNGRGDFRCIPNNIEFSKNNSNHLYLSGYFPRYIENETITGILMFEIEENKIINDTFRDIYSYLFVLVDKEERIITVSLYGQMFYAVNLINNSVEYTQVFDGTNYFFGDNLIYNEVADAFIGSTSQHLSMVRYDRETSVGEGEEFEEIVYPNPTSSIVTINNNCGIKTSADYQIIDNHGTVLESSSVYYQAGQITIDFQKYPAGFYFIRFVCGEKIYTYKVLKEG